MVLGGVLGDRLMRVLSFYKARITILALRR